MANNIVECNLLKGTWGQEGECGYWELRPKLTFEGDKLCTLEDQDNFGEYSPQAGMRVHAFTPLHEAVVKSRCPSVTQNAHVNRGLTHTEV